MASGFLGKSVPTANTWTLLYTVPSAKVASISINALNQGVTSSAIDIAISTSSTASGAGITSNEIIELGAILSGLGSVYERTGLVTDDTNGKYVWVRSSSATTSFQAYGYEE